MRKDISINTYFLIGIYAQNIFRGINREFFV